jgi:hypothetical protein
MFFHVRDGQPWGLCGNLRMTQPVLHMTTTMRSNNAFRILPFNLFEFSMLQEMVASELELPLGTYTHWASSMHVYDNEREMPLTRDIGESDICKSIEMPNMPLGNAMQQANNLAQLEAKLRHAGTCDELDNVLTDAVTTIPLENYWLELLGVLYCWNAAKRGYDDVPYHYVHEDIRDMVQVACQKAYSQ